MYSVNHHQRRPHLNHVSIERLFEEIRAALPASCDVIQKTSPFPSTRLLPRLRNLLYVRRHRADVHHIIGDVHYLAFALPQECTVLTIHDCAALNRLTGWKREILKYFWFTGPMRRAAVVTAISQTTKDELRKWTGSLADKVEVVPNCVGSEFQAAPKLWPKENPVCLQVGTGWNKNVERVAQALQGTGCRLEIVGELRDEQRQSLEASGVPYHSLGRVSDEELLEAYLRSDFLVFASLYEGFGLPIIEAQAMGRPVITSDRSSMPEAAGHGALFVNPESVESIRAAVNRVVREADLREDLMAKGFENVRRFRPEAVASQYAEIYERIGRSEG